MPAPSRIDLREGGFFMRCRVTELRCREVINVCTGFRMGFVYDVIVDSATGQILALVVPGPCGLFGIFGREDDFIIPWECVRRIGEDLIIVEISGDCRREKRPKRPYI